MKTTVTRREWVKAGILMVTYLVCLILPPTQRWLGHHLPPAWQSGFALNASLYALPIGIMLVFFGRSVLQNFRYFASHPWQKMGQILLVLVVLLMANLAIGLLNEPQSANQVGVNTATRTTALWASILLFVILGPMLEETIFRRILLSDLSQVIPKWLASGISCLGFLMIHVTTPQDIVAYAPLAIIFTVAYLASGENIAFTWSLHMLNNLIGVLAAFAIMGH